MVQTTNEGFSRIQRHGTYEIQESLPTVFQGPKSSRKIEQGLVNSAAGTHMQSYLQLSKTWEKGGRNVREKILEEFIAHNRNKTGPQLERELGNGASLFLTRISAWLRLTYFSGHNIGLQLRGIMVFVAAASGHRFLAEFMESGGVLTVLEILGLRQATEEDKAEALRLLLHMTNAGRKYKEFICESYGVRSVAECLARSKSEVTQDIAKNLLIQLGAGNPKYLQQVYKASVSILTAMAASSSAQQMAAQVVRTLLSSLNTVHASLVEIACNMLRNVHIQLQYEGYEILRELTKRPDLQDNIIMQLISILRIQVSEMESAPHHRDAKSKPKEDRFKTLPQSMAIYVQQAYASKLLGYMAATSKDLAERAVKLQAVGGLLNVIANLEHPECQKHAVNTLLFLMEKYERVVTSLQDQMGHSFVELVKTKPDTFYREMTRPQAAFLRKCNVRVEDAVAAEQNAAAGATFENPDPASSSTNVDAEKERQSSVVDRFSNAGKQTDDVKSEDGEAEIQEEDDGEKNSYDPDQFSRKKVDEAELLKTEVFEPYQQIQVPNTFSGSKFVSPVKMDKDAEFEIELEKYKNVLAKKKASMETPAPIQFSFDIENIDQELLEAVMDPTLFKDNPELSSYLKEHLNLEDDAADVTAISEDELDETQDVKAKLNLDADSNEDDEQ